MGLHGCWLSIVSYWPCTQAVEEEALSTLQHNHLDQGVIVLYGAFYSKCGGTADACA